MSATDDDDNTLMIRCPGCRQRFKVQSDFRNRMVECGVCEHRFQIHEDVIVRDRKFYPGEKRHHGLSRFQRIPRAHSTLRPETAYAPQELAPLAAYTPVPPQRIIAGFVGVAAMLSVLLLLVFGSGHGGPLDGMGLHRQLIMTGFTAVLGFALLLYANPNTKMAASILGGVLAATLIWLPFHNTASSGSIHEPENRDRAATEEGVDMDMDEGDPEQMMLHKLRERIGMRPLEQELERLASTENPLRAYGISLIGLEESNRIAVRDYMLRISSADPTSHIYPRERGNYLFVITGLEINIEELAALGAPLGKVRLIEPELSLIEILVDNGVFLEAPSDKLIDHSDPDFYELNLRELSSIDIHRIQQAVIRLADSEPRVLRADITQRLRQLLDQTGVNFQGSIARALSSWDEDKNAVAEIATQTAITLHQRGTAVPTELIALAIENPSEDLVPAIVSLWRDNTLQWENYCVEFGPKIESAMLEEFETTEGSRKQSAARILSKVGGEASSAKLRAALDEANRELTIVINQALQSIANRLGLEE